MSAIKILIADDEATVLEILGRRLKANGYDVIMASDGLKAWELIQKENPDVVVLDVMMPQLDGYGVLSQLRSHPPSKKWIPVIIVSAIDEMQNIQKGFNLEADHYLVKPCSIDEILKAIKFMLSLIPLRNI